MSDALIQSYCRFLCGGVDQTVKVINKDVARGLLQYSRCQLWVHVVENVISAETMPSKYPRPSCFTLKLWWCFSASRLRLVFSEIRDSSVVNGSQSEGQGPCGNVQCFEGNVVNVSTMSQQQFDSDSDSERRFDSRSITELGFRISRLD